MLRMIIYLILATLFLAAATWAGSISGWWNLPTYWIEILLINLFLTLIVLIYLVKIRKNQPEIFTLFYLLSIAVKMIGGLASITFIVWDEPQAAIANGVFFIICYLSFTVIEVLNLLKDARDKA